MQIQKKHALLTGVLKRAKIIGSRGIIHVRKK